MPLRTWAALSAIALTGCARGGHNGRIVVAITLDWEGAYIAPEGLDALDDLRRRVPDAPLTHFVCAAYFTKDHPDLEAGHNLVESIHPGDELATHLHVWKSLARSSGVTPRVSPSFFTGTDKVIEVDEDSGYDTDLEVYDIDELRAMLRTSRRLLGQQTHHDVSNSFRAGGYLGTPRVLQAASEEGYVVDSSATDSQLVGGDKDHAFLPGRVREVWPKVDTATAPFVIDTRGGQLVELPISATADDVKADEIVHRIEDAHARLQKDPDHDVFVVLGMNQETAQDYAGRVTDAIEQVRKRPEIAGELVFATVEKAAELVR
jgi:hypothetical protein